MNKSVFSIFGLFTLVVVLALAMFGFSVMSEPGHMMAGCFGTKPGGNCSMLSPIEHFTAHLHTFQSISTGIIQTFSLLALMLLALLALAISGIEHENGLAGIPIFGRDGDFISPQQIQFSRWLSLREKRDPSFISAVNR